MDVKSGLKFLVYFHRICGQSYLFWNFGTRMSFILKIVLLIMNTILLIATLFYSYLGVQDARKFSKDEKIFNSSHKSLISFIMIIFVSICYAIMNIYVFCLTLFRGKNILVFLNEMDLHIENRMERKIGLKAMIIQIPISILLASLFFVSDFILSDAKKNILNMLSHLFLNIVISSSYMCLLSLMAYFSYVVEQKLTEINREFFTLTQIATIFKQLLHIQNNVKKFKQFYIRYLFFIILFYSIACVSNLTIFYFDRCKTMTTVIASIFEALSQIFLFCYFSDKIDKSYLCIINKYEQLQLFLHETHIEKFNHCLISRLYSLREDMCFTAFDLYKINTKTFMQIISMIVTFSVILIQTT